MALVSVIIPMFNASLWIGEALQSVLSQEIRDIEIIAIDDGSSDGTAKIVAEEFPGVKLTRQERRGVSFARNLGTRLSSGEFIQYLDADDLLAKDKLRLQLEALARTGADIAYGPWQKLTGSCEKGYRPGLIISRKLRDPEVDLFTDFWSPPAAYLFRRAIVDKTGGWNESLPVIQDARFVLDCALYGARFVYTEGLMAYYREQVHGSLSNNDPVAFIRDCMRNAEEIQRWWSAHGGINRQRRKALFDVYGYIAREGFVRDRHTFEGACKAIDRLVPFYCFEKLRVLYLSYRIFGYRGTCVLLAGYRRLRVFL